MIATTFAYSAGNYSLTVDASKESVTSNWLSLKGCEFSRYMSGSNGTVRYNFFDIPAFVVNQLRAKFSCVVASSRIADISFIQPVDEEVEGLLDLHLEVDVIELAKFQASRTQPEVKVADINWLKPEEDEFDFDPHCIDVISIAKFKALKDAKRYKLRGEEVIKVSDISFPIADSIRRYKMRGFEVVKFAALAA